MTTDDFDPDPRLRGFVFVRLADHLQAMIADGRLPAGARLANQRDLATEYGVSHDTVARTVVELRKRGLVETFGTKGSYVVEDPAPVLDHLRAGEGGTETS